MFQNMIKNITQHYRGNSGVFHIDLIDVHELSRLFPNIPKCCGMLLEYSQMFFARIMLK